MNNHQFYNLLEGKIGIPRLRNGIYKFPWHFIFRYNRQIKKIEKTKKCIVQQLAKMTVLEKQHLNIVTSSHKSKEKSK